MSNDNPPNIASDSVEIREVENGFIVSINSNFYPSTGVILRGREYVFSSRRQMMNFIGKLYPDSKTKSAGKE